jgi:hypothetical protein
MDKFFQVFGIICFSGFILVIIAAFCFDNDKEFIKEKYKKKHLKG